MNNIEISKYFASFIQQNTLSEERKVFAQHFIEKGIPSAKDEMWKNFNWNFLNESTYIEPSENIEYQNIIENIHCNVQNFDAYLFSFLNGRYMHKQAPLTIFPNGVVIGSLLQAKQQYSDLINRYLQQSQQQKHSSLFDLASTLYQDGFFIYVPQGLNLKNAIQIINAINTDKNLFINTKNIVILEKNASLQLIHCDESLSQEHTLLNSATEIFVGENAHLDYYKLENKDNHSILINDLTLYQSEKSQVNTYTNVFNGGCVHNTIHSHLIGENAEIKLNGLFLVDKQQQVSNCLSVHHHVPKCKSTQLYNGIVDDKAQANFIGHIFVAPDAQKTEAYQINHNILLTDEATMHANPFLEIYADDVKCSHGATIGQLDNDAIFYLRSRGICEKNAKMLLMHAFAKEVFAHINIANLVDYLESLVEKRLSGQNISCVNCNLCSNQTIHFDIKMPEL